LPPAQETKVTAGQSLNSDNKSNLSSEPKRSTLGAKKGAAKKSTVSFNTNRKKYFLVLCYWFDSLVPSGQV